MQIDYPPGWIPEGTLITARSYLVDRIVPDCEFVRLPAKQIAGGTLKVNVEDVSSSNRLSVYHRIASLKSRGLTPTDDRLAFDFRVKSPENWSHFLNMHLPIFFVACSKLHINWNDARIIVPRKTPSYILDAARMFGIEVQATDLPINGTQVVFNISLWAAIRADWLAWVSFDEVRRAVSASVSRAEPMPKKVFLARQKTRVISNQREVEAFLSGRGFVTVYPEKLSVEAQFRLFQDAHTVVAVHGAGIAPLLYSDVKKEEVRSLIELLPCGHMTDCFRTMSNKVGWQWVGVRGRIKSNYVKAAYDLKHRRLDRYSLDSFEVDVFSLNEALALASGRTNRVGDRKHG